MKTAISLLLAVVIITGCSLLGRKSNRTSILAPTFTLTDTTGHVTTTFHSGEHFIMTFSLVNTSREGLSYRRGSTKPPVVFKIVRNDSTVATSIDGYAFAQVVLGGYLAVGDTLKGRWTAPTTPPQNPKVVLSPGSYKAKVVYPAFDQEVTVKPVSPVDFTVIK